MRKLLKPLDSLLNSITMYRVIVYGLSIISVSALILAAWGILPYSPVGMVESFVILITVCYLTNIIFAKAFNAVQNAESWLITALILFLLLSPVNKLQDVWVLFLAGVLAMASKYFLAVKKKHLFNPAALSVFILGLLGYGNVLWWVGSKELLIVVTIVGLLIVKKIRRFPLFFSFLITSVLMIIYMGTTIGQSVWSSFTEAFISWPVIFFGTIMLTEPLTMPPTREKQIVFGGLVGLLFGARFALGPIYSTPQLALLLGNIVSYALSSKQKLFLTLKEKLPLGGNMYEFVFNTNVPMQFIPGQYLEWTLPHVKLDSRGNRRYFTIASSPTEKELRLGVRIDPQHSSFKETLTTLEKGEKIIGAQLAGDFTLPKESEKKLVFIAGGIGVTPFRSMVKYLLDKNEKRNIVMFYASAIVEGFVYQDLFDAAKSIGLKIHYLLTMPVAEVPKSWRGKIGYMTEEMVLAEVPDYKERVFYLSGPNAMVDAYKELLRKMGVPHSSIVTDYFPGF
jgi:ferredoxin-NADP reductase/Na+-translocating ferredoxin:NAD+ oxidoreductase RnfD subunit